MKIVCDSCQAKYSIADEKVQGKAFKIRCKKCNHIIVVRSGTGQSASQHAFAAESAEAQAKPASAESQAVWHIVVDGEQAGPLSLAEVRGRFARGEIGNDTLVWRDGFADWVKLGTVSELAEAPTPGPAARDHHLERAAQEPAPARHTPAKEMPAAAALAAGVDVFGSPSANPTADLFASSAPAGAPVPAATGTPFSFGAPAASPGEIVVARPGNGAGSAQLTGQRNENSVLFSLANLEALAVPSQGGVGVRPPSATTTTEGSGLIDIRSMAAMTIGEAVGSEYRSSADSLPTFSTPQFSPVAPVLLPMAPSGPPKWLYPVLGVVGIAVVGLGYGIYAVLSKPAPASPPPVVIAAVPPAAPGQAPAVAPSPAEPSAVAPPARASEDDRSREKRVTRPTRSARPAPARGAPAAAGATTGKTGEVKPQPAAAESKPATRKGSIDDLLNQVGSSRRQPGVGEEDAPKRPAPVALATLSQSDIVRAMQAVQPRVRECYNQFKVAGTASTEISVAKGGRVASAKVTGKFAGTPTGACVESAARTARFPPCEAIRFPWPFSLR